MPKTLSKAVYQQKLSDVGFNIVEQYCKNPISNVWSATIHDTDCPLLLVIGNGITKDQALIDAYEILIGRLSSKEFWSNYYLGDEIAKSECVHYPSEQWFPQTQNGSWPEGVLQAESLQKLYNPDGELNANNLIDICSSNRNRGICCLPFESVKTGKIINFPINLVTNLYANNGIATGLNTEKTRFNALLNIVKEFTKFKVISEGISLPNVPESVLDRYPNIKESVTEIENKGFQLLVKDASLGGKYPVIALVIIDSIKQRVKISFGADPRLNKAWDEALLALFENESFEEIGNHPEPGFDMDEIASPNNLENHFIHSKGLIAWKSLTDKPDYAFFDWDKQTDDLDYDTEFSLLSDSILEECNDIFISEFHETGLYTCRILVPGFSEVYPTDDLVWENNNIGIDVRQSILKIDKTNDDCEQLIQDLEELNQNDDTLISTLIGMPSDSDCIFSDLCVAELITLLALKTQDNERIQEGCEWLIHYKKLNPHRLKVYQCINTILQLDGMTNYGLTLEKIYMPSVLNDALALIAGEDVFPLISEWKLHKQLINSYKKLKA